MSLYGMTPYETAEWHPNPDPRHPPLSRSPSLPPLPPSFFHHPLSPLANSAYTQSTSSSPISVQTRQREANGSVLCFSLLPSLFLSLSLSLLLTPLLQSLTPLPLSALGKQWSDPALLSWQIDRSENKQKTEIESSSEDWTYRQGEANRRTGGWFFLIVGLSAGRDPSSPLLSAGIPLQGWESYPSPTPAPSAQPAPLRMLWRMVHQENCSYQVVLRFRWYLS